MVTLHTTSVNIKKNSSFCQHSSCVCGFYVSQNKQRLFSSIALSDIFGAFTKLLKMLLFSLCLFVRPHRKTRFPIEEFSLNLIFKYFLKICRKNESLFNPLKTKRRPLYLKTQSVPRCKHFSSRL